VGVSTGCFPPSCGVASTNIVAVLRTHDWFLDTVDRTRVEGGAGKISEEEASAVASTACFAAYSTKFAC
jgi:hypothetical protein